MDVRALTVIFNVWSWKMRKKIANLFWGVIMIEPVIYVD